jgi:V/A-type H+-transporting ATPase subunit K
MADIGTGLIGLGAGLAIGISAIAAAVGATAENEKLFGKMLILTVIPETIVIFGLVIAYLLITKMGA